MRRLEEPGRRDELPHLGPAPDACPQAARALGHVHLPLGEIDRRSLDDALSMLREHEPLRGLTITRGGASACSPDEGALAGILQVHTASLKDLSLALPLRFSAGLTDALAGLGGLESLRLDNTFASLTDAITTPRLAEALGSLPNLRSLAVTGFSDAAALTACLPRLPQLQSLRISGCRAECQDWRAIALNLQGLQAAGPARLRHLELSAADANDADLVPLAPVLSGFTGLHELNLSGNDIGPSGMAMLAGSLQGMRELKILDLSGNRLHGRGIAPLALTLEQLPQLEELRLRGVGLAADAIGRLGAALRGSVRLQSLDLSFNRLSGCSAADWAVLLGPAKRESLCLSNCSLDSKDMAPLADGLKKCPTLKTLILTSNGARTPDAAQALAEGLAGLPQLETCHLPVLGKEGVRVLRPAVQSLLGRNLRNLVLAAVDAEIVVADLRPVSPGAAGR